MQIRVADCESDRRAVRQLAYVEYLKRGWCAANAAGELRHHAKLDEISETTVLIAEDHGDLLGTLSVTADGPGGLTVDAAFPGSAMATRDAAAISRLKLGAAWRLVVRPGARRCVRRALIDAALDDMVARDLGLTLYEVHPLHAPFYARRLGFKEIDRAKHNTTVCGAPAVLMLGRLPVMMEKWKQIARQGGRKV